MPKRIVRTSRVRTMVCQNHKASLCHLLIRALGDNKCCCGHTGRCTCALKKDHLETVPEGVPQPILAAAPKELRKPPQLLAMSSHPESRMTVFANGHHKPVHKIDTHNNCGAPYKIPSRSNTVHGHREIAQRSSDSLPLPKPATTHHESPLHNTITSVAQQGRRVRSEHNSPMLGPSTSSIEQQDSSPLFIPPLDPNAYSYTPFQSNSPVVGSNPQQDHVFPDQFPDNFFTTYEAASQWQPQQNTGGTGEIPQDVDWSSIGFSHAQDNRFSNSNGTPQPSQPPSYTSFDHLSHLSHPGMTSSSGEISETEDLSQVQRPQSMRTDSHDNFNEMSSMGGDDVSEPQYRLSTASTHLGGPAATLLASEKLGTLDIDDYLSLASQQGPQQQQPQAQQSYSSPLRQSSNSHSSPQNFSDQRQQSHIAQTFSPQPSQQQMPRSLSPQRTQQSFSSPFSHMTPASMTSESSRPSLASSNAGEHPYTIQEAQNYAHQNGMDMDQPVESPMPMANGGIDPMWSYSTPSDLSRLTTRQYDPQSDNIGWAQ